MAAGQDRRLRSSLWERRRPRPASRRRGAILEAAGEESAVHGFDGARVVRIASAAGVSPQLITYYFGSKQGSTSPHRAGMDWMTTSSKRPTPAHQASTGRGPVGLLTPPIRSPPVPPVWIPPARGFRHRSPTGVCTGRGPATLSDGSPGGMKAGTHD
ncbi:TetR family transcriptional regulator [Streptomyces sp. NPDC002896]|uniref:TetR family transcriptional regulator n=1 Tax=Streptomyces sp. NPDC002896 TaxID=3154438 RepID=UPI003319F4C7